VSSFLLANLEVHVHPQASNPIQGG